VGLQQQAVEHFVRKMWWTPRFCGAVWESSWSSVAYSYICTAFMIHEHKHYVHARLLVLKECCWRYESYGALYHVVQWIVSDVSKDPFTVSPVLPWAYRSKRPELFAQRHCVQFNNTLIFSYTDILTGPRKIDNTFFRQTHIFSVLQRPMKHKIQVADSECLNRYHLSYKCNWAVCRILYVLLTAYKKPTLHSYLHKTRNSLWLFLEKANKRLNLVTEHWLAYGSQ
jgi:hypothetical protein